MKDDITVIVLCGGKSSRMGQEKGLVLFRGLPMIRHILDTASKITPHVMIVGNDSRYAELGYPCFGDILPGFGPMGGIYTGLVFSVTQKNLILSCDIPFVPAGFLAMLAEKAGDEDILVPEYSGKTEPLCAVYDNRCRDLFRKKIAAGELKMQNLFSQLNTIHLDVSTGEWNTEEIFRNINTTVELEKYGKE